MLVAAEALWHLGSLFYRNTQYSQSGWFTSLFWCDIPWNKAPHTGPHHIWHTYTLSFFSGREMNTDGSGVGWMISLASAVTEHLLRLPLVFQPIGRWSSLGFCQHLQSNSSPEGAWNLSGYI